MRTFPLKIVMVFVFASLLAFPVAAMAKGPGGHGGPGGPGGPGGGAAEGRWMEKLNLTDDQKKQINEIRKAHREKMESGHQQLREEQARLRVMMKSDLPPEEVNAQFNKVQELRSKFAKSRFEAAMKIRSVLTVKQREEMDRLKEERHKNRMEKMHHRGPGMMDCWDCPMHPEGAPEDDGEGMNKE